MRCPADSKPCECDINSALTCPAPRVKEVSTETSMVFLNGGKVSFKCSCGCNVFAVFPKSVYECNACGVRYQGVGREY